MEIKLCSLSDIAVPSERNAVAKEFEKISKYKDLEIEIGRMWNTKTVVIPLVIGAQGIPRKAGVSDSDSQWAKINQ